MGGVGAFKLVVSADVAAVDIDAAPPNFSVKGRSFAGVGSGHSHCRRPSSSLQGTNNGKCVFTYPDGNVLYHDLRGDVGRVLGTTAEPPTVVSAADGELAFFSHGSRFKQERIEIMTGQMASAIEKGMLIKR